MEYGLERDAIAPPHYRGLELCRNIFFVNFNVEISVLLGIL